MSAVDHAALLVRYHALVDAGVAPDVAKTRAAEQLKLTWPEDAPARENVLEKTEQAEVRKYLIAYGFRVYNLSQSRPSKIGIGIPDLWFAHNRDPIAGWFEVKRQMGGQLSTAQEEFREQCLRCGVLHVVGDRFAAQNLLVEVGLAYRIDHRIEPTRRYLPTGST